MPISVNPSGAEIVYKPETDSYVLSVGVTVQLPVTELVELLLKFNQEQQCIAPAVCEPEVQSSRAILAFLPPATCMSPAGSPNEVYTPKSTPTATSILFDEDDFARIPICVTRQDPFLMDYRERSKWRREEGKFFVENAVSREANRVTRLTLGFKQYDEMTVNPQFVYEEVPHGRSGSMDSTWSKAGKLSADAPVFTPASAFTRCSEAEPRERNMSISMLPPSVEEAWKPASDVLSDKCPWSGEATRAATPEQAAADTCRQM